MRKKATRGESLKGDAGRQEGGDGVLLKGCSIHASMVDVEHAFVRTAPVQGGDVLRRSIRIQTRGNVSVSSKANPDKRSTGSSDSKVNENQRKRKIEEVLTSTRQPASCEGKMCREEAGGQRQCAMGNDEVDESNVRRGGTGKGEGECWKTECLKVSNGKGECMKTGALRVASRSPVRSEAGVREKGHIMSLKDLQSAGKTSLPKFIQVREVRLLSMSKVIKSRDQGKGAVENKGKGKDKGSGDYREKTLAINFGDPDGYVSTVIAHWIDHVPEKWLTRPLCNVFNVRGRVGHHLLDLHDAHKNVVTLLERNDANAADQYVYRTELCNECASLSHVQNNCRPGEYVNMALRIIESAEKYTRGGEVYLNVFGYDRERARVGPLRIWLHSAKDLDGRGPGEVWMLRGLRVSYSSRLSACVVDACQLTALEKCKNTNLANLFAKM